MSQVVQFWRYLLTYIPVPISAPPRLTVNCLPTEILNEILDNLTQDVLKTCALVCSQWRFLAQPKLFRRLVLSTQDLDHAREFSTFLLGNPHIRAAVHHVEVYMSESWNIDRKYPCNLVADVLELLPRPESLKLYGPRVTHRIKWTKLPQHLRNSIRAVLRRQTLSAFLIDGWVIDLNLAGLNALFAGCNPNLSRISLLELSDGIWGAGTAAPLPQADRIVLNDLTITNTFAKDHTLIEWLCKPESILDLSQLQTLHIVESRDELSTSLLLATAARSLRTLELNIGSPGQSENEIALNQNHNLECIAFSFGRFYSELYNSPLSLLCNTLNTLPEHDNSLKELCISLNVTHPRNTSTLFPPPPLAGFNYERWTALARVLDNHKYSQLEKVRIELIHHGIDIMAYSELVAQKLGPAVSAKVVWTSSRENPPSLMRLQHSDTPVQVGA